MKNNHLSDKSTPDEVAHHKLYLINLLSAKDTDSPKFKTYHEASTLRPRLAKIVDKLSNSELDYLIYKIENIL